MSWKEHKKQLMKDPTFRKEYEALEPEHRLASDLIRLRLSKGLTQEELARKLHTSVVSHKRLNNRVTLVIPAQAGIQKRYTVDPVSSTKQHIV
jgi:hypothetical protein